MRRRSPGRLLAGTAPLLAAAAVLGQAAPAASAAGGTIPGWRLVTNIGVANTLLTSVVALPSRTAWAGGIGTAARTPVLYHLGGGKWSLTKLPGAPGTSVGDVAGTSATNVWAMLENEPDVARLTSKGWVLKSFARGPHAVIMDGVTTTGPKDTWAFSYDSVTKIEYASHFNGTSWSTAPMPAMVDGTSTSGLASASSPGNVWTLALSSSTWETMHFDGAKWHVVSFPANIVPPGQTINPRQILARSASDVWATVFTNKGAANGPVVLLHYNGKAWSKVSGKLPAGALAGPIAPDGGTGLWLLGSTSNTTQVLLHYAGGKWTSSKMPADPLGAISVQSLSLIPGTSSVLGVGAAGLGFGTTKAGAIVQYGP